MKLTSEPAADDIDRDAPTAQMVESGDLLGHNGWMPRTRQDRRDQLEAFRRL